MLIRKVLSSYTFRFISLYVTGLGVAVLVVLSLVYAAFSYDYFNKLGHSVAEEMEIFEAVYSQGGIAGVNTFIEKKPGIGEPSRYVYLVVDKNFRKLAGDLDVWPQYRHHGDGWLSFQLDILNWEGRAVDANLIARTKILTNGHHLLVARHFDDVVDSARLVGRTLISSLIVTVVLGAIGGFIVGAMTVRHIDNINRSLHRIMSGDLSERIDSDAQRGEIKQLTRNINHMLDRIQMLMEGMLQVSDNIAHDLRTPLTRLRNHLSELQEECHSEDQEQTVQHLIQEADSILTTFNALLRIARIEAGSLRAAFTAVDPKTIMLDVIELYEPLAMEKSVTVSHELADGITLKGDRDLLFQALANLVDNAIKYTPENGNIDLRLSVEGRQAVIGVADSGCGIPTADRPKVFRRFYRVETSRSRHPGNGLGLSLVWAVVKLHEGDIDLADNHPGLAVEIRLATA